MQHLNYWVLRAAAREIEQKYVGTVWYEAFSQQKDELVIGFASQSSQWFLRVGCMPEMQYVIPVEEFRRAKTNTVVLFDILAGKQLYAVKVPDNERMMILELSDGFTVVLKMHGTHSNVIVYEQEEWVGQFRSRLSEHHLLAPFSFEGVVPPFHFTENPESKSFQKQFPWWDKSFQKYWKQQLTQGIDTNAILSNLSQILANPKFYLGGTEPGLYLFPLESLDQYTVYDSACVALAAWLRHYFKTTWFFKQKQNWVNRLKKLTEKSFYRVESYIRSINQWEQTRNPEELGHLIMANLTRIPPQATQVEVEDFYHNQSPILIRLNPDLNPQQNAEHYYQKQKERKSELEHLEKLLEQSIETHERLSQGLQTLEKIESQRELNKFVKANAALWQKAEGDDHLPFRIFEKQGYQILVGKNAQSNDTLTVSYAKKDDLWLHAKDVSGSHVVIRKKDAHAIPKPVIEYAAGLAAYYSKYRHQKWVAVTYTHRKYVRKNKQLAAGQVLIDREDVIFVTPTAPF